jgi:hypothetical protein
MQQIHNNGFFKLKTWSGLLYVPFYTWIFVYGFYLGYIILNQY